MNSRQSRIARVTRVTGVTGVILAAAAAALAQATLARAADSFPHKPIRIIVPSAPGGTTDIAARLLAERMGNTLGQNIVLENRAGAAGIIGVQVFLAAAPDGYSLLMGNSSPNAINYALYKNLSYKPEDMIPITSVISNPNVLVVNPTMAAKTVSELVALAKASPGKLSFASAGRGTSVHMSGELLRFKTGIDIAHVPYRGSGPALIDLLAGQVNMIFSSLPSTMGYIRSGRLRALAVTARQRRAELPEVPTMIEAGYADFEVTGWFGLFAAAKTPRPVIDKIYAAAKTVLASPEIKARFTDLGGTAGGEPPEQFKNYVMAEKRKWAQVAAAAKIQPE